MARPVVKQRRCCDTLCRDEREALRVALMSRLCELAVVQRTRIPVMIRHADGSRESQCDEEHVRHTGYAGKVTCPDVMEAAASVALYYVALNGSDANSGTSRAAAFATLRKCVAAAPAGGTCVLGGGRYDRATDWPSGAPIEISRNVTVVGDPQSATRAVLDGSVAINTQWTAGKGDAKCVYTSAAMDVVPWQIWVTGRTAPPGGIASPAWELDGFAPLTPARFPNARLSDDSVFDSAPFSSTGRTNSSFLYSSKTSTPGKLTEDGTHVPSLASSGLDLTGAIAVLPLGTMAKLTQGVAVVKHGAGAADFTYKSPAGTAGKGHTNLPFYFEGACALLDAEGEWCVGSTPSSGKHVLKVWLDGCVAPSSVKLRGKRMDYLINVTARKVRDLDSRVPRSADKFCAHP